MCRRRTSALNKIAFVVLLVGCLFAVIGFSAPFWVRIPDNWSLVQWDRVTYRGLWSMCCPDTRQSTGYACVHVYYDYNSLDSNSPPCTWIYTNTFTSTDALPTWYKAAEAVYCIALVSLFISILLQFIFVCSRWCEDRNCFPTSVASSAGLGAIMVGTSLGIYGGCSYKDGIFAPLLSGGRGGQLEWAFYIGIAGSAICFSSATLFYIDGCIQKKHYREYKSPVLGTK